MEDDKIKELYQEILHEKTITQAKNKLILDDEELKHLKSSDFVEVIRKYKKRISSLLEWIIRRNSIIGIIEPKSGYLRELFLEMKAQSLKGAEHLKKSLINLDNENINEAMSNYSSYCDNEVQINAYDALTEKLNLESSHIILNDDALNNFKKN